MHRNEFLSHLKKYYAIDQKEQDNHRNCLDLITSIKDPFNQKAQPQHFTATACIVSPDFKSVLLIKHGFHKKWVIPGGHCDGIPNIVSTAQREAFEETGIKDFLWVSGILDMEVYRYEMKGKHHIDHDVTFLFIADPNQPLNPEWAEVDGIGWFDIEQMTMLHPKKAHFRLQKKLTWLRDRLRKKQSLKMGDWSSLRKNA